MMNQLLKEIRKYSHPDKAKIYARFFKTGKGEYGEGDLFLGLTVPEQRTLAKKYTILSMNEVKKLLYSKYHEHRLTGLLILVYKYEKADSEEKDRIIDFYIKHRHRGNNWDFIDCIADKLLGNHLIVKDKSLLYNLAKSESIWDRRIAIITTFAFIKNKRFEDTIKISEILLNDKQDLIQKAVGWMLREMGKRDESELIKFLDENYRKMPRTMLRYSIERLDEKSKKYYLKK
ncbi:DNA alkylation repair protein [Candidatus Woesearchaeota archaeon]|nr:DNA alkylation repair protein [Candidatus Woesearchaeota archaeon]